MSGCSQIILEAINECSKTFDHVTYVEMGIAEGRTLSAVGNHLKDLNHKFTCIGVDIENGWSLNVEEFLKNIQGIEDNVILTLVGSQGFLELHTDDSISFLLIDACHSRECCAKDFIAAEKKVRSGGFVAFHDTASFAQNIQPQPHCNQPCHVMGSLEDLALIGDNRPGWRLFSKTDGEPTGENNGMMIFRKD